MGGTWGGGGGRPVVLVVDDDAMVARSIAVLLEEDYEVVIECVSNRALTLLDEKPFDIIICDLAMPDISGPEFYDQLAERDEDLARRIVFVTGGPFSKRARDFVSTTTQQCLDKPFTEVELRSALDSVYQDTGRRSR